MDRTRSKKRESEGKIVGKTGGKMGDSLTCGCFPKNVII